MSSLDYELLKDRIRRSTSIALEVSVEPEADDWADVRFGSLSRLPAITRWRATARVAERRGGSEWVYMIPGVLVESGGALMTAAKTGTVSDYYEQPISTGPLSLENR